jgi:RNA polymerase-interacting CarD/CdnL/TRCF family regulator
MAFKVDEKVVYPAFGVGRIVALVNRRFLEAEMRAYYEVVTDRSTAWVRVDDDAASGLRRLTSKAELAHYRAVLRGQPALLNQDHRQRHQELQTRFKRGTLQDMCEMVRDLSGRGWVKGLSEADSSALRKSRDGLLQEWAAADDVTLPEATAEINALLQEGRQTFQGAGPV